MTSRGLKEADFVQVATFIDRAITIAKAIDQVLLGSENRCLCSNIIIC